MSISNGSGVIRVGRKGLKKFAFGDDGEPFEVDVVVAFQTWIGLDDEFRESNDDGDRRIPVGRMPEYHATAVHFVASLSNCDVTTAEALDFIARLREQYDELAVFFRPKLREERDSPDTSEAELHFSEEGS